MRVDISFNLPISIPLPLYNDPQASITADLVRKLGTLKVSATTSTASATNGTGFGTSAGAADQKTIIEKSVMEYRNLMRYILDKGVVMQRERNILARFRSIHLIDDAQHEATLKTFEWCADVASGSWFGVFGRTREAILVMRIIAHFASPFGVYVCSVNPHH